MAVKVGINGFGRIGRLVFRVMASRPQEFDVVALYRNHTTAFFYMAGPREDLADLVRLTGEGRIDPVIDTRFPLSDAAGAEARLAAREQFGKIVVMP